MQHALDLVHEALARTLVSFAHNWPYLLASILVAAALKAFVDQEKVAGFLRRWEGAGVLAATGAAVATPFCSCGTTAVILGMMASSMPLAPIVAFMVASPLSSPEGLLYGAGLFGWPFALFHFGASIAIGLAAGAVAATLERRGLLAGQARFAGPAGSITVSRAACPCAAKPRRARRFWRAALEVARKLIPMFVGFAFIGYFLNGLIPPAWISALFGEGKAYSVPLAATIGFPLYLSSEASLPLVRAFLDSGMSRGAIMAFLIAGSGTSIGAISGALTIARGKVVGLVVAALWIGAIAAGYGFDLILG
ncbi:MAG TPA: permease [Spirochaetales bacterium]|nr:permease [Spirochaetales bacterium]HRY54962.1 permease [Spirochaetia bacterium]HRZ65451.1 permease [Spirochaetia bacterium]